jgi:hypothetical protein
MAGELMNHPDERAADTVQLPAPTPWPIVLAFGIALLFAGLVTSAAVSVLGAVLSIAGALAGSATFCRTRRMKWCRWCRQRRPSPRCGAKSPEWKSRPM